MKRSIWFQTDLGFEATRQNLINSKNVIGDMEAYKGILTFYFKNLKDFTIQITTQGKLGIFYPETSNYENILEKLKPLLVKADGSPIEKLDKVFKESSTEKAEVENEPSKLDFWSYLQWRRQFEEEQREKRLRELKEERRQLCKLITGKEPQYL